MDTDKKGHIRFLFNQRKKTISQIAREAEVSRLTVRRALNETVKEKIKRESKLDPYKEEIKHILDERPHISNVIILDKIRQKGYQGGRSILGDYLLELRGKNSDAYLNIETLPGREAQADWAYCGEIKCGLHKRKLYMFCMVLSYSRYLYIEFTVSMNLSVFLSCHINAFNYFGGVPSSILYDNLKSVVLYRNGSKIHYNGRFLDFASWYGFNPKVCNPRSGNEKGKVERAIHYIRNNFLSSYRYDYPESSTFDHIRAHSVIWLSRTANRREHSVTRKIPLESFTSEEKPHLIALAEKPYDYAEIETKSVSKDCLVKFETNRYSVPSEYASQLLTLKAYTGRIKIFNTKSEEVANHKRCYDKFCVIKNPLHYKTLLERKKKAFFSSRREAFRSLCPEAEAYLSGLNELTNPDFHVEKIISLAAIYGNTATAGAVARANEYKAYGWEYIRNILLSSGTILSGTNSLPNLIRRKELLEIEIDARDLSFYDETEDENTEDENTDQSTQPEDI